MTRPAPPGRERADDNVARPPGLVVLAILAAAGAGILWFTLAIATGLIFHFLPGAAFLAGAWTYRWRSGGGRATGPHVAIVLFAGAAATSVAILALVVAGRRLDSEWATAAVAAAGALLAATSLRWPGLRPGDRGTPESALTSTPGTSGADRT